MGSLRRRSHLHTAPLLVLQLPVDLLRVPSARYLRGRRSMGQPDLLLLFAAPHHARHMERFGRRGEALRRFFDGSNPGALFLLLRAISPAVSILATGVALAGECCGRRWGRLLLLRLPWRRDLVYLHVLGR